MLFITELPSMATMPPSARRFAGFSERTTDSPAPRMNWPNSEIHGVVERIRSIVHPRKFTSWPPKLVISSQSFSRSGTSPGIIRVNRISYSPSQISGSVVGSQSQTMLFSCLPVSSPIRTRPSSRTARLSGPARLFTSHSYVAEDV